jgi:peptidoglycan/xylan/chitin deacetylase (PgdA/CDA1 family)
MTRPTLYKAGLNAIYYTGAFRALRKNVCGVGVIFTLHRVRPSTEQRAFAPNRILEITPEFLEATIIRVRQLGYQIVSLDEAHRRLVERDFTVPFVSFTLDDGYADNYLHAFPIFMKHNVPFAIYVCTGIIEGSARLWWRILDEVVFAEDAFELLIDGRLHSYQTATTKQKYRAFNEVYWALRGMAHEEQMATMDGLEQRYEQSAVASRKTDGPASWKMLSEMLGTGLLTVGAHTISHDALSKLSESRVSKEMKDSRNSLESELRVTVEHFAYPYGDAASAAGREFKIAEALGFKTAVTTRKGSILPEHAEHLLALPRVSLNGDYQNTRYVDLFLSEVPFFVARGFRRLDVE